MHTCNSASPASPSFLCDSNRGSGKCILLNPDYVLNETVCARVSDTGLSFASAAILGKVNFPVKKFTKVLVVSPSSTSGFIYNN